MGGLDDSDVQALRSQIAALTAAVQALGAKRASQPITFQAIAERYGPRVGKKCMYTLVPFLEHFGDRFVQDTRRADYLHFRDLKAKQRTYKGEPPSVGTLNQELRQAQAMMRWAIAAELLDENPFEGVPFLKGQRPRETEIDPLEHAQAFADAPLLVRVFQAVCIETGMRNGCEARMMEWTHIDRAAMKITVPRTNAKGKRVTRTIPMSQYLLAMLEELPRMVGTPYVFASPRTKRPYSRVHLTRLCRPYLDRLQAAPGDKRVVTHDGRHGFVSRLARGGVSLFAAMKIAGHQTAGMHWRYSHVAEADQDKARAVLDEERKRPHRVGPTEHLPVNKLQKP